MSRAASEDPRVSQKRKKKKKGKALKVICVVFVGLIGTALILSALGVGALRNLLSSINILPTDNGETPIISNPAADVSQPDEHIDLSNLEVRGNTATITNILLLGLDARDDSEYGRSDTMMIASINDQTKTVKLISLMRDTWATIPGCDYNGDGLDDYAKLNAAYSSGGFSLLQKTVRQNFCLDIDQYVAVNFDAFCVAVDALGGLDVELDDDVVTWIPAEDPGDPDRFAMDFSFRQIREPVGYYGGTYHLQGFQVLSYCRVRYAYPDSDYSRQQNQRKVVGLLIDKAKHSNPADLWTAASGILPQVTTNMTQSEIENYIVNVFKYSGYTVETEYHLPAAGQYINRDLGASGLWITDPESTVQALHEYIYG